MWVMAMNVHYTHRVSVYWPTQHKKRRHHIVSVAKSFWDSLEAKRVSGGMSECIRYCAALWGCERPWAGTFIRHSQSGGCRRWCSTVENYRRYDVSSSNGDNFHIHSDFWGMRKRHLTTIVHKYFLRSFHPFCSYRMTLKGRFFLMWNECWCWPSKWLSWLFDIALWQCVIANTNCAIIELEHSIKLSSSSPSVTIVD